MKDVAILKKKAEAQGWTVDHTHNGHLRFFAPAELGGGYVPSVGLHSQDWRAIKNTIAQLKRKGLRMNGQKIAAQGESLYMCVDCGYPHPYEEMMLVPRRGGDAVDPRPTRYCKEHFKVRKTAGRRAQVARDAEAKASGLLAGTTATLAVDMPEGVNGATPPGEGPPPLSPEDTGAPAVMGEEPSDGDEASVAEGAGGAAVMGQTTPTPAPTLSMGTVRALEASMHELTEALLGGLADLERRVDARLGAIEQVQTEGRTAGASAPAQPAAEGNRAARRDAMRQNLERFSLQLLWLAQFDEDVLSLAKKQEIARAEAAKLAAQLS